MKKLLQPSPWRTVFLIWLGWVVVLFGYQALMPARLDLARPDYVLFWTPNETQADSQADQVYLTEPFLNSHVSWDSEFYLAIANAGYDSDDVRRVQGYVQEDDITLPLWPFSYPAGTGPDHSLSLNHAFFPFYPLAARAFNVPFSILGMNPIATTTLSAVMVSVLGTLAAMLALYELAKEELGEDGGIRAAFYLVIFPSGFFLAQVYTEGLFVGLAFASLVLMRRGRLGWAAVLAIAATFTRAVGVGLIVPLAYTWWKSGEWRPLLAGKFSTKAILNVLLVLSPLIAFGLWRISYYGLAFGEVERLFFGRGLLSIDSSMQTWSAAWAAMFSSNTQATAYYLLEFGSIALGVAACIIGFRRHPDLAMFSALVIFFSLTSGQAQGMHRYILAAPSVFLVLADWGRSRAFDRTWIMASVLWMGLMATLFTFDMWAG
ncbi:MAG: hypothetical protein WD751_03860 [Anaerolineales bacterium]